MECTDVCPHESHLLLAGSDNLLAIAERDLLSFTGRMGTTLGAQWVPPERLRADCSTTLGIKPTRRLGSRPLSEHGADQGRSDGQSGAEMMSR